ncbi:hypothetical protein [Streptomyces sp. NPDC015130]|uniref:hypothetical protein n=1 Tax=Streptomyces sp. NPDC015130 TaxID=3364940 RepID=UPI0036FC0170
MNTLIYWLLIALCTGVEIWGQVIGNHDLAPVGLLAGLCVIAVARLLYRANQREGGEEG